MFMNYPCAKGYTTSSSNIKNTNSFQFLVILHRIWLFYHGMVSLRVSYLLVDPIFIKIKSMNLQKKYFARFRMHCTFNEYKNSCSGKPKVETGGKYKCLLCMGVARIDGRGK